MDNKMEIDPEVKEETVDDNSTDSENEINDEKVGEDASLDSSSSDDSDNDSEEDKASYAEIDELERQVEANLFLYDQHVRLIQLLKHCGDLERVRQAHERMRKIFPLTEALWLDWLRDEADIAVSQEEKEKLCVLFDDAVNDYLSIEIWLEYCQFSIGCMGMKDGLEKCRGIFERAITSGGLHVSKGHTLWEAYREFEIALLSTMQFKEEKSAEEEELMAQQTERILNIFKRQLSVPLIGMDKTLKEFMELSSGDVDPGMKADYKKVLSKLATVLPFEEKLKKEDSPRLGVYQEYLDFELKKGEPSRTQCLFERALVENCLVPDMWVKYTEYLDRQLKIECLVLPVYERALRNCPWSLCLWQGYLRALERYQHPTSKMKEVAERALAAGFTTADEFRELWMTYLGYLRRQISWEEEHSDQLEALRATFDRATKHLFDSFGTSGDPLSLIPQFQAKVEARYCKNMDRSREIWDDIIYSGHSKHAQMWLEYINLEKAYGSPKALRKVFFKALQATTDYTESIGEAWMNFERDEGTLEQWEYASSKCAARLKTLTESRHKEEAGATHRDTSKKERNFKQQPKGNWKKAPGGVSNSDATDRAPNRKKRKFEQSEHTSHPSSSSNVVDSEGFKVPVSPDAKSRKNHDDGAKPLKISKLETPSDTPVKKKVTHDSSKDERTLFLSNLSFDLPEDKIRETFSKVGEITDLRMVKDFKGRSRGYGYIEFACWDLAIKALKLDRELIEGRPVFVSKCEDKTKAAGPTFKYKTGLEKNKLFIKGLPFSITKEQLENLFKPFGTLKEVRLVTFRNGNPKGLAFVEYNDEAAATSAVLKMDGQETEGYTISVAISNPPERGARGGAADGVADRSRFSLASLGGGAKDVGARGRGRTQVSLLPRSVMRSKPAKSAPESSGSSNGKSVDNGKDATENSTAMSNSDFRKMLLQ